MVHNAFEHRWCRSQEILLPGRYLVGVQVELVANSLIVRRSFSASRTTSVLKVAVNFLRSLLVLMVGS